MSKQTVEQNIAEVVVETFSDGSQVYDVRVYEYRTMDVPDYMTIGAIDSDTAHAIADAINRGAGFVQFAR